MTKYEFWTDETEEMVSKYVTCVDIEKKNKIYDKHLHIAFMKLIDIVVERYYMNQDDNEVKNDLLYSLIINVQRFNPNKILPNGKKPNSRSYCEVIIRSAIADRRVRIFHEKQNVRFDSSHEKYLKFLR
jgi:hypothetical protein